MEASEKVELIDRYLKNELTGEELALFEKQIQEEPALLEEIELQRTAIQTIKVAEIRNILRRTHQQITEEEKAYPAELEDAYFAYKEIALDRAEFITAPLENIEFSFKLRKTEENKPAGYVSIAYEGETNPPFPVTSAANKKIFNNVKIVPASGSKTFHYQLTHTAPTATLHLYGEFNSAELTLIYHKEVDKDVFKLRVQTKEYLLQPNKITGPLLEMDKSA